MKKFIFAVLAMTFMATSMAVAQEMKIDKMPKFSCGEIQDFNVWVLNNFKYPEEAIKQNITGKILVEFVVKADGTISSVKTLKSPSPLLTAEAERVIKSSPKWEPGEVDGKKVSVKLTLPISLAITEN